MMQKQAVPPGWEADYGLSPGVMTKGGTVVWLSGHVGVLDADGRKVEGGFDVQTRQVFANLRHTLAKAGGALSDVVSMTVFIADRANARRFTEIRREYFPSDFPASALIVAAGFALPEIEVEIQGVAVLDLQS